MSFNHREIITIKTNDEIQLENVPDFKYLGALMVSTEKDVKARKAATWRACSKLGRIWKSSLPRQFKQRLFAATVESVLLYGCEAWTVTTKLAKELDGCYTRLLRTAFNVHWSQHMTNKELYGNLPKVSEKIRERRLRFAGHSCRNINEPISQLLLWKPKHGKKKPGRPHLTYTDLLKNDTGLELSDVKAAMLDRNVWKAITARAVDPT